MADSITVQISKPQFDSDDMALLCPQSNTFPLFFSISAALISVTMMYHPQKLVFLLVILIIITLLGVWLLSILGRRRRKEFCAKLQDRWEGVCEIGEEGLHIKREFQDVRLQWPTFSTALESTASFWLVDKNGKAWLMPKKDNLHDYSNLIRPIIAARLSEPRSLKIKRKEHSRYIWLNAIFFSLALWLFLYFFVNMLIPPDGIGFLE